MAARAEQGSTLSPHRAFVVHLASSGRPGRRRFQGRVEHLSSGQSTRFSSVAGLLAFFDAIVAASPPAAPRVANDRHDTHANGERRTES